MNWGFFLIFLQVVPVLVEGKIYDSVIGKHKLG